ncbi:hypothetical protein EST38_g13194, partial [Candolleomyces aberdarensis]
HLPNCRVNPVEHLLGFNLANPMIQEEVAQDTITEETGGTSVDHSTSATEPGTSGWEKDLERLRAKLSTQMLKDWEDSQKLSDDFNKTRLAFTRQTLDLQADKVKLLEELNTAKSAPLLHQIKLLEELNTARAALTEMTAEVESLKLLKSERAVGLADGPLKELRDELAKHGLSDAIMPQEPQAQVEARERLQELQQRWQTLKWTSEETYDIEGGCGAYELAGGMFIKIDGEGNIFVLQLPTYRDPVYKEITNRNLGIKPCGFTSDPSQDLIVFTEISSERGEIWVYSLHGLNPHPEAAKPNLQVPFSYDSSEVPELKRVTTQIAGNVVAIFVCTTMSSRLVVWNWKTGKVVGVRFR